MRRILFIWLPDWAMERYRRRHQQLRSSPGNAAPDSIPFALIRKQAKGLEIAAVNGVALDNGVSKGQMLTDARSICPNLAVAVAEPEQDHMALHQLAHWCRRFSPLVSLSLPDGIAIDITGCAHLFGGEAKMLEEVATRLAAMELSPRLGLADNFAAAWAIAAFSPPQASVYTRIIAPGQTVPATVGLPVAALRLSVETVLLLHRLGLKTIASVNAIPRAALKRRFSSRNAFADICLRLDQLSGTADEPLEWLYLPVRHVVKQVFAEPVIEPVTLAQTLPDLLDKLVRQLEKAGKGARGITLTACRVNGTVSETGLNLSRPSRQRNHITRLLKERLDHIDPGYGIDAILLTAHRTQDLNPAQVNLDNGGETNSEDIALLVDRLANRLGMSNIHRLGPVASHIPERAQVPAGIEAACDWPEKPDIGTRPFRLLAVPEAITAIAEVPDGPPLQFIWRRLRRRVAKARGPERIAPEWWRVENTQASEDIRDYYDVEDIEGHRYWLYREGLYQDQTRCGPPRWFMHGLFG